MITAQQCLDKFGTPDEHMQRKHMDVWVVPADIREKIPCLPERIFCSKLLPGPLERALRNLISAGLHEELVTWDGCFNVRKSRGLKSWSTHAWGLAVDLNAATNALGAEPTLSPCFVGCFIKAGFHWGGVWSRRDGMHFQLAVI